MTDQQVVQQQEEKDPRPLSMLIEDGRKLHPRTNGDLVRVRTDGTGIIGTCVIGAICEALTGELPWNLSIGNVIILIYEKTGIDLGLPYIHPLTGSHRTLSWILTDLNDSAVPSYSDAQIIAWLREHEL